MCNDLLIINQENYIIDLHKKFKYHKGTYILFHLSNRFGMIFMIYVNIKTQSILLSIIGEVFIHNFLLFIYFLLKISL